MPRRKVPLATGEIYHICSRSIADFKIFNSTQDFARILEAMIFYSIENPSCSFSEYKKIKEKPKGGILVCLADCSKKLVEIITYCIMPTHIHFILKQLKENGISDFLKLLLKSYSSYFNIKHNRKGPLWEGRFSNILIKDNDQFAHVTRYIHLNPVTARLVEKPEDWIYSSYREYIDLIDESKKICDFSKYLDMDTADYAKFVNDRIGYQRELALIKHLTLE